jgi:V8-like Glu-specific endopeptidase
LPRPDFHAHRKGGPKFGLPSKPVGTKDHVTKHKPEGVIKPQFTETPITDYQQYPNRCIGLVVLTQGRSSVSFTGCLLYNNFIVTVGNPWPWNGPSDWSAQFIPGYSPGNAPFGTANITNVQGYNPSSNDLEFDYAVCKLDRAIGDSTGWLGIYWSPNNGDYQNVGGTYSLAGYPPSGVQIEYDGIAISRVENQSSSTQLDTGVIVGNTGYLGSPFFTTDLLNGIEESGTYVVAVLAGEETEWDWFTKNTYQAMEGGQSFFGLYQFAIDNWT